MNILIYGDNFRSLTLLQKKYKGKVNLIYIDPPFATNSVFRIDDARTSSISMSSDSKIAYSDVIVGKKYLSALKKRLKLAYGLLSDNGSMYLHIDHKIAYDVKPILDDIFGDANFRNSIARIKSNPKNFKQKGYGNIQDTILFYTKSKDHVWNDPHVAPGKDRLKRFNRKDSNGFYTTVPLYGPGEIKNGNTSTAWNGTSPPVGRHWRCSTARLDELNGQNLIEWSKNGNPRLKVYSKQVASKGVRLQDIWKFKDPACSTYPTEKNLEMLETIVKASTNPNDIVLDFYCGSGTALLAAAKNSRRFVGIDSSMEAIKCCAERLKKYEYDLSITCTSIVRKSCSLAKVKSAPEDYFKIHRSKKPMKQKLTDGSIRYIIRELNKGKSTKTLSEENDVTQRHVQRLQAEYLETETVHIQCPAGRPKRSAI